MSRRVPLRSAEGRRLVEQGPAWREHPDYYRDEPDDEEPIPWFTQQHVRESVERMKAWAGQSHLALVDQLSDEQWENLARMALDMRVRGPE